MNLIILSIIFFIVGVLEMLFWALQTKSLIKDKMLHTFIFTFVSVVIWFYVVSKVAENVNNLWLMVAYSVGCGLGACVTIKIDSYIDKIAKARLWKRKKKIRRVIRKK